jgi:capsular exopolysaccharide synthesis family protein
MSGEGKSFLCINMSITLAMAGKRVLLLEMDLRKPKVSRNLGLKELGFTNYIISPGSDWRSWVQPSGVQENFDVLSSGPIPPNPTELLLLPKTKAMFEEMKKEYDYVVIDSPPIGLVTDAEIMAPFANATLYLVRHQLTHRQQVRLIDKFFQKRSLPKLNIIVNDAKMKKAGYSYSYSYGYGYGYGEYGEETTGKEKKKRKKAV